MNSSRECVVILLFLLYGGAGRGIRGLKAPAAVMPHSPAARSCLRQFPRRPERRGAVLPLWSPPHILTLQLEEGDEKRRTWTDDDPINPASRKLFRPAMYARVGHHSMARNASMWRGLVPSALRSWGSSSRHRRRRFSDFWVGRASSCFHWQACCWQSSSPSVFSEY